MPGENYIDQNVTPLLMESIPKKEPTVLDSKMWIGAF